MWRPTVCLSLGIPRVAHYPHSEYAIAKRIRVESLLSGTDKIRMAVAHAHPVNQWDDQQLHDLLMRVDDTGFPNDLEHLWRVERVRYRETLRRIPPAASSESVLLDLGSSRPWLPFYRVLLGYERLVLNTMYPGSGFVADDVSVEGVTSADVRTSVFDIERDPFPFPDDSFDVVLCLEVVEHLAIDPMGMMAEVNRVLRPGGVFVLTTPNVVRYSNMVKMLLGEQPQGWSAYNGYDTNRHNREYAPAEIELLLQAAGITPAEVSTFGAKPRGWQREILKGVAAVVGGLVSRFPRKWRRDVILATGRKTSSTVERRPAWLYFDLAERQHLDSKPCVASARDVLPALGQDAQLAPLRKT